MHSSTRSPGVVAALAAGLVLAACGSSSSTSSTGGGGEGNGESSKSGDQILSDTRDALKNAKSYHLTLSGSDASGSATKADLKIASPSRISGSVSSQGTSFDLVVVDGVAYLRGNAFFQATAPQIAAQVGDHYVKLPGDQSSGLLASFSQFTDPAKLGDCLIGGAHGTLTVSQTQVNGQDAAEVKDAGDKTGTQPGLLDVANTGPTLPIRVKITGPPNGPKAQQPAACSSSGSSSSSSSTSSAGSNNAEITFDQWNQSIDVTPPADALDLLTLATGGGSSSGGAGALGGSGGSATTSTDTGTVSTGAAASSSASSAFTGTGGYSISMTSS